MVRHRTDPRNQTRKSEERGNKSKQTRAKLTLQRLNASLVLKAAEFRVHENKSAGTPNSSAAVNNHGADNVSSEAKGLNQALR